MKTPKKSKSIQIYLNPGIKEEEIVLKVWEACQKHGRAPNIFRSIILSGLQAVYDKGELPQAVVEECNLDLRLRTKNRKDRKVSAEPAAPFGYPMAPTPYGFPAYPYPPAPYMPPMDMGQGRRYGDDVHSSNEDSDERDDTLSGITLSRDQPRPLRDQRPEEIATKNSDKLRRQESENSQETVAPKSVDKSEKSSSTEISKTKILSLM